MASIKYLQNINLFGSQLQNAIVQPLGSAPTVYGNGQIYYDSGVHKLYVRANGSWQPLQSGTDGDTTYELFGVGSTNGSAGIQLDGSDGTLDNVLIVGSGTVGVTRSGNTLTVTGTDSATGTVTSVAGGTGITISGNAALTPTVNIDYSGTDNAILAAGAATPVGADTIWFSDAGDSTIKKALISAMPGFGNDGTVTSVGSGAGLTGGTITGAGSLAVDYSGADNVILAANDGTAITVVATDKILVSDATDTDAKFVNISQITAAIGGGTVTSVSGSGGSTGLTLTGGAITTSGTLTLGGTLNAVGGGTGQSSYAVGDILYASSTTALSKLNIGSAGQVLKVASGVPSWAADSNSGGTVTSITNAADSGTGSAITTSGTFTYTGGTNVTTSVTGTTVTINTSATTNLGTVTSITTPTDGGLTGGTIITTGELRLKNYAALSDDTLMAWDNSNNQLINAPITFVGNNVSVAGDLTVTGGDITLSGTGRIQGIDTVTNATDAASKGYVDSAITGQLIFQGGYDASTSAPTGTGILQGFTYVVTVAGNDGGFWTIPLEIGDLIISNQVNPVDDGDWTEVNKNVTLATNTTVGVASFAAASFAVSAAGSVSVKAAGISNAQLANTYNQIIGTDSDVNTSGVVVMDQINVTDGVITSMNTRTLPTSTTGAVGVSEIATQAEVDAGSDSTRYVTPATLASHIGNKQGFAGNWPSSNTASQSITHGLNSLDVLVQVVLISTGDTVFCGVERDGVNTVIITTSGTTTANTLRVLVSKV
jgi:hypothetical protein|tara:strand:+ start:5219 stop:7528 length:2310 start_codon:yes stop_codon:yes gene_type:complete